ncbi:hypothetical protein [Aureivirga sp. CE67]|uniref:hypothetical protein n=1 Tax=Aureivirga sp. CE67 TaxID=1788983 RepID=UPI0018C8ECB4|nr:hypothetical protein [Aureivirga sp. CE67]
MKKTNEMRLFLILILLSLKTSICFGQNIDSLTSKESNLIWIQKLDEINSKESKLELIKKKIRIDSIVSKADISEKIFIKVSEGGNVNDLIEKATKCKTLFFLKQKKVLHMLDLNQYPNYSFVLKYLTIETIESIEIVTGNKAISNYGTIAQCGVVILNSNRKLKKVLRKIK